MTLIATFYRILATVNACAPSAGNGGVLKAVSSPLDVFISKPVMVDPVAAYKNCPEESVANYSGLTLTAKGEPFSAVKAPLFASTLKPETVPSL